MHMFSWSIGIAFGIASYSLQAFEYLSLGNCFLSEQWAEPLFFYPLIAITVIMSLPFFITTFHIAYVILRDPVSKPRLGNRRGSAANILNLRIKLRKFLLLQWRPLVWNSANIIASYTFIISYYKFLKPYNNAKSDSIWEEEWINCLYSANGSQDYCSKTVSMNNLPSISSLMIVDVLPLVPPLITLAVFIPASSIFSEIRKYIYRRESKDSSFLSSIQSKGGLGSWAQESLAKGYKEFTHDVGLEGSQIYNSSRAGGGGVTSMDCNVTLNRRLSTRHKHHQQLHTLGDSGQVLVVQGTSNADAIDIADEEIELQKM